MIRPSTAIRSPSLTLRPSGDGPRSARLGTVLAGRWDPGGDGGPRLRAYALEDDVQSFPRRDQPSLLSNHGKPGRFHPDPIARRPSHKVPGSRGRRPFANLRSCISLNPAPPLVKPVRRSVPASPAGRRVCRIATATVARLPTSGARTRGRVHMWRSEGSAGMSLLAC